jgi:hypothetical protein
MALRINITFGRTDKVKLKESLEFLSSILKQSSDVHEIQIFDKISSFAEAKSLPCFSLSVSLLLKLLLYFVFDKLVC